ncbi:glycerophosphoryl diester phosphodiesterase [Xaviernesmea oryzae]|uniref:Glycerophosphoryl diester phosphodiesterase n=1 Tax=Xaviernesmea oryzae TaxID=464029 RepID=A0A1X7FUB9_9HYPH|nr:glycerophosphodiester phosphodiesterase family protein [Xaviernesmea oryzae]SMF58932.1 glycerophosphoryl diester phosphodiesterase [Xaviernesmea oryzae]
MSLPAIIAHRGYSTIHRENSPAAWVGAIEAKADYIEVDVRVTGDGKVVCCHDKDLKRLADREDAIAEVTSKELAAIEAYGFPAAPALALLFETVPESQPILFDVKDERPEALDILLAALREVASRDLVLGLHAPGSVGHVRTARWTGSILGLVKSLDEEAFFEAGGDILRIWEWDTAPGRIAGYVDNGRPVWITAGEGATGRRVGDFAADDLLRMARQGASGFLVNDPVAARQVLAEALEHRP